MKDKLGQVFTPSYIADVILDEVGYVSGNILNKKIMEPSFGNGVILLNIVHRLVAECRDNGYGPWETARQIERNVHGIEIDKKLYDTTIAQLDSAVQIYGLSNIKWSLFNQDALDFTDCGQYDFVVGNPPYIRIHDIDYDKRQKLKSFKFTSGTTDVYVAFYELGLRLLNKNGKLCYISPDSILKNTSQKSFREYILANNLIEKIIEYKSQVFENADTYSAIIVLSQENKSRKIIYQERELKKIDYTIEVNYESLVDQEKWSFGSEEEIAILNKINKKKIKIGDLCTVQNGIATNKDSVYIGKITEDYNNGTVRFNEKIIEKNILKPIIKGSRNDLGSDNLYILFPYEIRDGKVEVIKEDKIKELYPLAYKYLKENKKELDKRDMDAKQSEWYRYARSQGMKNAFHKKLVVQHIVCPDSVKCVVTEIPADTLVYSGIYVTATSEEIFAKIKSVLTSKLFCKYCKIVGKSMSGGYKSISTRDIKNFKI